MQDNIVIKAPAKLNLFLRIIGQKNNGYHIIRTGITFLDLYDEISISLSNINKLSYTLLSNHRKKLINLISVSDFLNKF